MHLIVIYRDYKQGIYSIKNNIREQVSLKRSLADPIYLRPKDIPENNKDIIPTKTARDIKIKKVVTLP